MVFFKSIILYFLQQKYNFYIFYFVKNDFLLFVKMIFNLYTFLSLDLLSLFSSLSSCLHNSFSSPPPLCSFSLLSISIFSFQLPPQHHHHHHVSGFSGHAYKHNTHAHRNTPMLTHSRITYAHNPATNVSGTHSVGSFTTTGIKHKTPINQLLFSFSIIPLRKFHQSLDIPKILKLYQTLICPNLGYFFNNQYTCKFINKNVTIHLYTI